MIEVTATLYPKGDQTRARVLGRIVIVNDGTGDGETGNYDAQLFAEYCQGRPGRVMGFRRTRQSVWTLVGRFLKQWHHT